MTVGLVVFAIVLLVIGLLVLRDLIRERRRRAAKRRRGAVLEGTRSMSGPR